MPDNYTPSDSTAKGAGRPRDREVMDWCENTGPWLPWKHRTLLKLIGEFADPSTGDAYPSQELLARILTTSRQTINKYCQELEELEVFTVDHQDRSSGDWTYNVYHLAGFESGWAVTVPQAGKPYLLMSAVERQIHDLAQKLANAVQVMEDHGIDTSAFIVNPDEEDLPERVKFENATRGEEDEGLGIAPMTAYIDPVERLDLAETSLNEVSERLKQAQRDPIVEFVDANLDRLLAPIGPFTHGRGGVLSSLRKNPGEFERWRDMLEGRKGSYQGDSERNRDYLAMQKELREARQAARERGEFFDSDLWYRERLKRLGLD